MVPAPFSMMPRILPAPVSPPILPDSVNVLLGSAPIAVRKSPSLAAKMFPPKLLLPLKLWILPMPVPGEPLVPNVTGMASSTLVLPSASPMKPTVWAEVLVKVISVAWPRASSWARTRAKPFMGLVMLPERNFVPISLSPARTSIPWLADMPILSVPLRWPSMIAALPPYRPSLLVPLRSKSRVNLSYVLLGPLFSRISARPCRFTWPLALPRY